MKVKILADFQICISVPSLCTFKGRSEGGGGLAKKEEHGVW